MAFYPCDFGGHWNPKRNYLFYWAVGSGLEITRWRRRYCALHASIVQDDLSEYKVDPVDSALGISDLLANCFTCGDPIREGGRQLFLTCYPADDQREDYWARIHDECSLPPPWQDNQVDPPIVPPQNVSISPQIANPPRSRDRTSRRSEPR